jgi:hypothetical protein
MPEEKTITTGDPQWKEDLEHANTHGTYIDPIEASYLTEEHKQYLLQRHGTLELDPLPTGSDADPYNWPTWKVSSATPSRDRHINNKAENTQPGVCSLPRMHVCIRRLGHHPSVRKHRTGSRRISSPGVLLDFVTNCYPRSCPYVLATAVNALWSQAHFYHLPGRQHGIHHRLCKEQDVCCHGNLSRVPGFFHLTPERYRECSRGGDVLQEGESEVYGCLDCDDHGWYTASTTHLWVCHVPSWLQMDLLDLGYFK